MRVLVSIPLSLSALLAYAGHAAVRQVGPGKQYAAPCSAIAAAAAGDTVQIDASGDVCGWTTSDLTLQGVQGKAIWVISRNHTTVDNIDTLVSDYRGGTFVRVFSSPGNGFSLTPVSQHVFPSCYETRTTMCAAIDAGAFEYGGGGGPAVCSTAQP